MRQISRQTGDVNRLPRTTKAATDSGLAKVAGSAHIAMNALIYWYTWFVPPSGFRVSERIEDILIVSQRTTEHLPSRDDVSERIEWGYPGPRGTSIPLKESC